MDLRQITNVRPEMLQRLKLTIELQQAIKLLQLTRLELLATIQQELAENPVLEEIPVVEQEEAAASQQQQEPAAPQDGTIPDDDDWKKTLEEYRDRPPLPGSGRPARSDDLPTADAALVEREDLYDHLLWQLQMSKLDPTAMVIGTEIIGNLGENGDLAPAVVESIAEKLAVPLERAHVVRRVIQRFDPVGVASISLEDCLLVQAEVYYPEDALLQTIIRDHLAELVGRNMAGLARKLGVNDEDVEDVRDIIMTFDPKPGRSLGGESANYVEPDVFVEKAGDDYIVFLNEDGLPKLRLSAYYTGLLETGIKKDTREYLKKKVRSAEWFMKSIHQRQQTIRVVAESIVRFQKEFLDRGMDGLKPLVLRDVAADIKMHESTVSRVTTAKYMHTPRGLFPMKFFFNARLGSDSGDDVATQTVKEKIRILVAQEDPRKPLSDSELVARLSESGVRIARRTVAKYRELLGILASSKRIRPG